MPNWRKSTWPKRQSPGLISPVSPQITNMLQMKWRNLTSPLPQEARNLMSVRWSNWSKFLILSEIVAKEAPEEPQSRTLVSQRMIQVNTITPIAKQMTCLAQIWTTLKVKLPSLYSSSISRKVPEVSDLASGPWTTILKNKNRNYPRCGLAMSK